MTAAHDPIPAVRVDIAQRAVWQVDAVLQMLERTQDDDGAATVLKAVMPRLLALTSVVMSSLGDELHPTDELLAVVDRRLVAAAVQS